MSHALRITSTLRLCSRAFNVAIVSLFAALSTCGAALPSSPDSPAASAVESAAPHAGGAQAHQLQRGAPCQS